jgi:thiamine-phosphate pyrophosphorylase
LPPERKPIFCYVTDRHLLRSASGAPNLAISKNTQLENLLMVREAIRNAAIAGVDWIQIREKDLAADALAELVRAAVDDTRLSGSSVLVNDRLDVAWTLGAAGVHLGEASLPVESVAEWRRSAGHPNFRIGKSCHTIETAKVAERDGADYIFFGPIFSTPSKAEFGAPQGIERLRQVCSSVQIPVLAIGGITLDNAVQCLDAGAAWIAGIRLFQESHDGAALAANLRSLRGHE